jgi:hypothetical protein
VDYSHVIIVAMETILGEWMAQLGASPASFPPPIFSGHKVSFSVFVLSLFVTTSSQTNKNQD